MGLIDAFRRLRDGTTTASALLDEALGRALDHRAFRIVRAEAAAEEARLADAAFRRGWDPGPLAGLPLSVKDLYGLPGERTFAGSAAPLPERFEHPGPVVSRALRQLAVFVGKTHTVELAFGGIGTNPHFGTPENPAAPGRVPGGSSSGAGVSVAEGSSVLALGTDTAGSVRIPAAWTGQVGLKTTKGRWPTAGIVPLSTTLDTPGFIARSVEDAMYGFAAFDGPPDRFASRLQRIPSIELSGQRLAVLGGVFAEDLAPEVQLGLERARAALSRAGATMTERPLPGTDEALALFRLGGPTAVELAHFLRTELPGRIEQLDPNVRARLDAASELPAVEYLRRRAELERAAERAAHAFDGVDGFLSATVASVPPRLEAVEDPDDYRRENLLALRNTGLVSFLGLCAISLPIPALPNSLPVGLQLIGPPGDEPRLLGLARAIESALRTA